MSFLYYSNLPNIKSDVQAKMLMERADNGFWEMQIYLHQAIEFLKNTQLYVNIEIIPEIDKEENDKIEDKDTDEEALLDKEISEIIDEENTSSIDLDDGLEQVENKNKTRKKSVFIRLKPHPDHENIIDIFRSFMKVKFVYHSKECRKSDRIAVISRKTRKYIIELEEKPRTNTIYIENNTYNLECQKKALMTLKSMPDPLHYPLLKLIDKKDFVDWPSFEPFRVNHWYFLDQDRPGTDVQRNFVNIALATPDFAILEGPPGTGKTVTICELIMQVVQMGGRVLLCASTHVAVDNVLENFVDKDYQEINPVRIGDIDNLSPKIKKFQYDLKKKTLKKELLEYLKGNRRYESQEYFYEVLNSTNSDTIITNLILDNANLICGTTIGFLQHPLIRTQQKRRDKTFRGAKPIFDLLIIDEASKTTFNEFLVPALFAKKWILVGDPKQLSPYVETSEVESNLMGLLSEENQKICLEIFNINRTRDLRGIFCANSTEDLDNIKSQLEKLNIDFFDITHAIDMSAIDLYKSKLIIGLDSDIRRIENFIPLDLNYIYGISDLTVFESRNNLWLRKNKRTKIIFKNKKWYQEIAWRIIRSYELRLVGKDEVRYEIEIEQLMPSFISDKELADIFKKISTVNRISLPSIIELLQKGLTREKMRYNTTLTDGFTAETLSYRHRILEFQHRMHPDISNFPRRFIYNNDSLIDPPYMETERHWNYTRYKNRCIWLHAIDNSNSSQTINEKEIEIIITELNKFLDFTKSNPSPPDRKRSFWEVAILTFYLEQESAIRKQLRKKFKSNNFQHFWTKNRTVHIQLCTVDRFQGHEAEIVFLSFVRNYELGFLNSPNRLNVAITRARYQLVIIGNNKHFANQNKVKEKSRLLIDLATNTALDLNY